MSQAVDLVALECLRCGTPVPAEADEVAWICSNCGQGLLLDEAAGLKPLTVHFAAGERRQAVRWRPFWVAVGRVGMSGRESYGRDAPPDPLWAAPARFIVPAFAVPLERAVSWGTEALRRPPELVDGESQPFEPATVPPEAVGPLARFVVLSVEAAQRDKLERIAFTVDLDEPELWCLPVAGD